jgi:hypothetical protein
LDLDRSIGVDLTSDPRHASLNKSLVGVDEDRASAAVEGVILSARKVS